MIKIHATTEHARLILAHLLQEALDAHNIRTVKRLESILEQIKIYENNHLEAENKENK